MASLKEEMRIHIFSGLFLKSFPSFLFCRLWKVVPNWAKFSWQPWCMNSTKQGWVKPTLKRLAFIAPLDLLCNKWVKHFINQCINIIQLLNHLFFPKISFWAGKLPLPSVFLFGSGNSGSVLKWGTTLIHDLASHKNTNKYKIYQYLFPSHERLVCKLWTERIKITSFLFKKLVLLVVLLENLKDCGSPGK